MTPATIRLALFAVLLAACASVPAAEAEFAMRWAPKSGGPSDLAGVSKLLKLGGEGSTYAVRYFDVSAPASAPQGATAIVRERVKNGHQTEVTWKYRSSTTLDPNGASTWICPLRKEAKRKEEVDISVLADGAVRRTFSRSCTSEAKLAKTVPANLNATQKGCSSNMKRRESSDGRLTAEEWRLSNGTVVLEVSMKGKDSAEELQRFKQVVVSRLLVAGVTPLDRSKTEFGTQCQ